MKRVLITGAGSYIGESLRSAFEQESTDFSVEVLDVRDASWESASFSGFDSVIHVAGIAHQRETAENAALYYEVNRDLAIRAAEKAKAEGAGQFVLFSSMSVYGEVQGHITAQTQAAPCTHYGRSKLMAEEAIMTLADEAFRVAVIRPPMIYGKGCKGNYPRLSALLRKLPMFPRIQNERSMLYIGHLCAWMRLLVASGEGGLYFPQNRDYVKTSELARQIAKAHGKKLWLVPGFGWLIRLLASRVNTLGKVFGSLTYDQGMSSAFHEYEETSFAETIRNTEESA